MNHRSTREAVEDLRKGGWLVECPWDVDPHLEVAEIQRRVYAAGGPAVYFPHVRGCSFPLVSNLFGSLEQCQYLFRHSLRRVRQLVELKIDPTQALRHPLRYARAPLTAWSTLPKRVRRGPVQEVSAKLTDLPQIVCWPDDGGAFITLPQVLSQSCTGRDLMATNLGMYRVQISGNDYFPNQEVGLHYQIRRGIGVHHREAVSLKQALPVTITVGGAPAMTLSAVMPLPEGLSELVFAGALAGHRIRMIVGQHAPVYADADFAISGYINPAETKLEGPFGDHLGYYSLRHPFPVMHVQHVWHRRDAVWPFTVVGRPPQEDTSFGQLIHELTGPVIPTVLPGIKAVHAVDAAGVHPLLLAIGSERFTPYAVVAEPQELLTQAHSLLGNGQLSLAKYLWIANIHDDPALDIHDVQRFFQHMLERIDWRRDLHFETRTTIDTLDYSGDGFNRGSKVVLAAVGPARRTLPTEVPAELPLPAELFRPKVIAPGILALQATALNSNPGAARGEQAAMSAMIARLPEHHPLNQFPLVVLCDDSEFMAQSFSNFLWATFTRSQPASDIYGVAEETVNKHWGCRGSLVIDARRKPHHAPPLIVDPEIARRVDALATRGGPLARFL